MDPDVTLMTIRALVSVFDDTTDLHCNCCRCATSAARHSELKQRISDLDLWLSHGGFPPNAWQPAPTPIRR